MKEMSPAAGITTCSCGVLRLKPKRASLTMLAPMNLRSSIVASVLLLNAWLGNWGKKRGSVTSDLSNRYRTDNESEADNLVSTLTVKKSPLDFRGVTPIN